MVSKTIGKSSILLRCAKYKYLIMGETITKSNFKLPNESVVVKFIPRKKGMAANVDNNHVISGGMLTNAKRKFSAPLQQNGSIANILTKEEKEFLESATGLNLSVYGDFWTTFQVSLFKDDASNKFDLSNPMDYISIKVLESYKDEIATEWNSRNKKQTYDFVVTRDYEIGDEKKSKLDTKKEAFKIYGKIEDDREKLIGVLKLLSNQPISKDSKLKWIQGQVEEYVDTMPSAFLNVMQDHSLETKMLINKAVDSGYIVRKGNKYSTVDGLELSENKQPASFDNAVVYLDNPKHQDVRDLITAKINK
jgi:hypothetical protein